MTSITINFDKLGRELGALISQYARQVDRDLDQEMQRQALLLRNDIVAGWPVDTGVSRAGFQGPFRVAAAHYRIINNFVYAPVIEFGGYRGVGPKTAEQSAQLLPGGIQVNQGIYPTQRPAAPVRRALSKRTVELREALSQVIT